MEKKETQNDNNISSEIKKEKPVYLDEIITTKKQENKKDQVDKTTSKEDKTDDKTTSHINNKDQVSKTNGLSDKPSSSTAKTEIKGNLNSQKNNIEGSNTKLKISKTAVSSSSDKEAPKVQSSSADKVLGVESNTSKNKKTTLKVILIIVAIILLVAGYMLFIHNKNFNGVAAKIGNVEIMESEITDEITKYRASNNMSEDADWFSYLDSKNIKASEIRSSFLDTKINTEVTKQIASNYNIEVTQAEIEKEIAYQKKQFDTEQAFLDNLSKYDYTLEMFTNEVKDYLLSTKVSKILVENAEVPDSLKTQFISTYKDKLNGSKGFYQLMFTSSQKSLAKSYLDQINSGQISFEDAVKKLTSEDTNGYNFDYVAYDCLIQMPDAVKNTMAGMNIGDKSGLIEADGYIYIIKLVDIIQCEELFNLNQLPEQTQSYLNKYIKEVNGKTIYNSELDKEKEKIGVVKYDMPVGTSYARGLFG